jgi:hypothetical protein
MSFKFKSWFGISQPLLYVQYIKSEYNDRLKFGSSSIVRYHDKWSKELNACILILAHMVYL